MILAIDQGTTGTTVLLIDRRGRVAGRAYAELPQHYPHPGWVEHRPDDIIRVTWRVIRRALSDGRIRPGRIEAIGITNQRETTILWDRHTGQPVHNAIVWQSRVTADICDEVKAAGQEPLCRARTGLVVDAYRSRTSV